MKYDYFKLYQYIFGNWANIEMHIRQDLSLDIKNTIRLKKQAEIKNFFKEIFSVDSESSKLLRSLLRFCKNEHLENILFNNTKDKLEVDYSLPDEKIIQAEFQKLDDQYHCFSKVPKLASEKFSEAFKIGKLVGDMIEENNDGTNSLAYLHAYKLLVLFGENEKNICGKLTEYLTVHNYFNTDDIKTPLHDALIHSIPSSNEFDVNEWRKIIKLKGSKAFRFLSKAVEIDKTLGRAPKDLNEIIETLKKINYKRASENEELATLFLENNMSEHAFNKSLDITKRIKKKDNLPDCVVEGEKVNPTLKGYYLVKLPINDPRAFVLGKLTNCCQSIGVIPKHASLME